MYHKYIMKDIFERNKNIGIQGEIAGPGIQKNPMGLKDVQFFVFNIYDIIGGRYYDFEDMQSFCLKNNLMTVEIERIEPLNFTLEQMIEIAKGKYSNGNQREGIVVRPLIERYSETLKGRASFKVINNDYKE